MCSKIKTLKERRCPMNDMPNRIKERRIAMGLTQEELAEKLGLQKSAIAKYENGRVENIKRSIIQNMAIILHCKPSYLLAFEEEPIIMSYYNQLNTLGQETATEHVRLLTLDKKYTDEVIQEFPAADKKPLTKYSGLNAAHLRTDVDFTDEERAADDAMMDEDD